MGEEIIISKAGKPMAKLVPYTGVAGAPRQGGFLKGQIKESADCWESDEELNATMTSSPLFPESPSSTKVAEEAPPYGSKA